MNYSRVAIIFVRQHYPHILLFIAAVVSAFIFFQPTFKTERKVSKPVVIQKVRAKPFRLSKLPKEPNKFHTLIRNFEKTALDLNPSTYQSKHETAQRYLTDDGVAKFEAIFGNLTFEGDKPKFVILAGMCPTDLDVGFGYYVVDLTKPNLPFCEFSIAYEGTNATNKALIQSVRVEYELEASELRDFLAQIAHSKIDESIYERNVKLMTLLQGGKFNTFYALRQADKVNLDAVIRQYPEFSLAYYERARFEKYEFAMPLLQKSVQFNPQYSRARSLIELLERMEQHRRNRRSRGGFH
ncbi:MAG: hypothetical protein KIT34_11525 [Cyanobacteria bacterium TGS_CYA1]|nr:hypothetical protein [Cyanobacteria bacterium TGS_CYA1]